MSSNSNNILIVGCGLLGSMIAPPISAFAVSLDVEIGVTLVDFDKVEKRNSPSNLGVPSTIGQMKVDVVAPVYEAAGIKVNKKPVRITEKNLWLAKGHALIVGALDNVESRQLLLKAAQKYDIPYIDLGLSAVSGIVSWSHGDFVTMPFASEVGKKYSVPKEKLPACDLVATRIFSATATECAAISIFIYMSGHDPAGIVYQAIGRQAEAGDTVNWYISMGDGRITSMAKYIAIKEASDDTGADAIDEG